MLFYNRRKKKMDNTLLFILIDELLEETTKIEENLIILNTINQVINLEEIKHLYNLFPHIICVWFILNILGNTIKMTFKVPSKYIIWILLVVSIVINFVFFGISFESFFIAFITFSFSVSSYDLVKYFKRIVTKV